MLIQSRGTYKRCQIESHPTLRLWSFLDGDWGNHIKQITTKKKKGIPVKIKIHLSAALSLTASFCLIVRNVAGAVKMT